MVIQFERHYDPAIVSNKFEVGERIEWIEDIWFDRQNTQHLVMGKGIIEHIRPRVVIIAQELANGTVKHWRIERFYLQGWIYDKALLEAISKWEGSKQKKAVRPRRIKSDVSQTRTDHRSKGS